MDGMYVAPYPGPVYLFITQHLQFIINPTFEVVTALDMKVIETDRNNTAFYIKIRKDDKNFIFKKL